MFCVVGYFQPWAFIILFDKLACFGILNTYSLEDKEDESNSVHCAPKNLRALARFFFCFFLIWEISSLWTLGGGWDQHAPFSLLSQGGRPIGLSPACLRQLLELSAMLCGSTQPALLRGLKLRLLRTPSWEARPKRDVASVFILLLPGGIASFAFLWDIQLSQWQAHSFNAIMVTIIIVAITVLNGGVTLLPKLALNSRLMWFSRLSFLSRWVLRYVPLIVAKWYYYYYYHY